MYTLRDRALPHAWHSRLNRLKPLTSEKGPSLLLKSGDRFDLRGSRSGRGVGAVGGAKPRGVAETTGPALDWVLHTVRCCKPGCLSCLPLDIVEGQRQRIDVPADPCQNCLQRPLAEKTARGCLLNRPVFPDDPRSRSRNWTEIDLIDSETECQARVSIVGTFWGLAVAGAKQASLVFLVGIARGWTSAFSYTPAHLPLYCSSNPVGLHVSGVVCNFTPCIVSCGWRLWRTPDAPPQAS